MVHFQGTEQGKGEIVTLGRRSQETPLIPEMKVSITSGVLWMSPTPDGM